MNRIQKQRGNQNKRINKSYNGEKFVIYKLNVNNYRFLTKIF